MLKKLKSKISNIFKKSGAPALLFIVFVSLFAAVPFTAEAATISISADITELEKLEDTKVVITTEVKGIAAAMCDGAASPAVVITKNQGPGRPPELIDFAQASADKSINDVSKATQSFDFPFSEDTDEEEDVPLRYRAHIACLTRDVKLGTVKSLKVIAVSRDLEIKLKGSTANENVNYSDVKASVISSAKEYILPEGASSVTLKLNKVLVRDKKTNKPLEFGQTITKDGDQKNDRTIEGFYLGADLAGKGVNDWDCDGYFSNFCDMPVRRFSSLNPIEFTGGGNTFDIVVQFGTDSTPSQDGGIYIPLSERVGTGKPVSIQIIPTIVATSDGIDLPFLGAAEAVTIKFDPSVTKQEERGGPTKEIESGATETDEDFSLTGAILSVVSKIIGGLVVIVSGILYGIFFFIFVPLIEALLNIQTYTGDFAGVIRPGWEVVKNVSYLFFIVALLVIALSTIFRVQNYQWKHTLVQIVIAAILVNFSLVIGQEVLGLADTVQSQFLPQNDEAIRALGKALMFDPIVTDFSKGISTSSAGSGLGDLTLPTFYLALSLAAFLMFFALIVMLAIRIVALWILLMLSPFAYALRVLHPTEHYAKEWWDQFLKYAFFTPIIAFFLNITAYIAQNHSDYIQKLTEGVGSNTTGFEDLMYKSGGAFTLIIFMLISIKVASSLSIMGAKGVTNIAEKGLKLPAAKLQQGAKFAGGAAKDWGNEKVKMPVKNFLAKGATSDSKFVRTGAKMALIGDVMKNRKHNYDERMKIKQEQYGAAIHDAGHIHEYKPDGSGGKPSTEARDALVHKYTAAAGKDMAGKTVKEIMDELAKSKHSGRSKMEKQGQLLATLVELAKRKETGTLMTSEGIKGTGMAGVSQLLSQLEKNNEISTEMMDRYAGRLNDVFVDTKQFQNIGVDIARRLDFDQDTYNKFESNSLYSGKIEHLQQVFKDSLNGKAPKAGTTEETFVNELKEEIRKLQIKKMVKLGPGEFAKNVKAGTLETPVTKTPNDLAWNFVAHMTKGNAKQKDKDPTQLEVLKKIYYDPNAVSQLNAMKNVLTENAVDGDAQHKLLKEYLDIK